MRKESRSAVFVTRHFLYMYIVLLSLSLILALLGQFVVRDTLQQSTNDAFIVHAVSQQRLLSQKVSTFAQSIASTLPDADFQTRQHYKETLSVTLLQWQQVHDRNSVRKSNGEASSLLNSLEPHYHSLLNASYTLLASINAPLHTSHAMITAPVQSILHEEPTYLRLVNMLLTRYQQKLESSSVYLLYIDFIAFGGTAIVVVESLCLLFICRDRFIASVRSIY